MRRAPATSPGSSHGSSLSSASPSAPATAGSVTPSTWDSARTRAPRTSTGWEPARSSPNLHGVAGAYAFDHLTAGFARRRAGRLDRRNLVGQLRVLDHLT